MFGAIRFLLAYMVVLSHLSGAEALAHFGYYAVRGFFILSGYVITASLHETYGFQAGPFWLNRLLKLLPPYYLVCGLTLLAITAFPVQAASFLRFWSPPPTPSDLLLNLTVIPLQFPDPHFRFVPPMWSVGVEIVLYFVLWSFAARSWRHAVLALSAGLSYHVACMFDGLPWSLRYFAAPSALLSFPIGALIYFVLRRTEATIPPGLVPMALCVWAANLAVAAWTPGDYYDFGLGYYLNIACFAVAVLGLAKMEAGPRLQQVDKLFGELAYPMFLSHWLAGFLFVLVASPGSSRGVAFTLAATPVIVSVAYLIAVLIRLFLDPVRARVRSLARMGPIAAPPLADATVPSS